MSKVVKQEGFSPVSLPGVGEMKSSGKPLRNSVDIKQNTESVKAPTSSNNKPSKWTEPVFVKEVPEIEPEQAEKDKKGERLKSLDALRGFNMFFLMGGTALIIALCNFITAVQKGDGIEEIPSAIVSICNTVPASWCPNVITHMSHVAWHGIRQHDMIFPIFLFLAGVSFPFSWSKQRAQGRSVFCILLKNVWRAAVLVLLGVFVSNYNSASDAHLKYDSIRFASVLGHIGIAWMIAAFVYLCTNFWTRLSFTFLVLFGYWLLLGMVPAPDSKPDAAFLERTPVEKFQLLLQPNEQVEKNYSMEGCIVGYVDRNYLPGKLYKKIHDPEGLLSIVPAIITALLGMMTGACVRRDDLSKYKKTARLFVAGVILIGLGLLWNTVFPFNKNLWTSSFVCFVGGISIVAFSLFYLVIDVWKQSWLGWFFAVIGMNSITIYLANQLINFRHIADFFMYGLNQRISDLALPVAFAAESVLVAWIFLYILYRKKSFIRF